MGGGHARVAWAGVVWVVRETEKEGRMLTRGWGWAVFGVCAHPPTIAHPIRVTAHDGGVPKVALGVCDTLCSPQHICSGSGGGRDGTGRSDWIVGSGARDKPGGWSSRTTLDEGKESKKDRADGPGQARTGQVFLLPSHDTAAKCVPEPRVRITPEKKSGRATSHSPPARPAPAQGEGSQIVQASARTWHDSGWLDPQAPGERRD